MYKLLTCFVIFSLVSCFPSKDYTGSSKLNEKNKKSKLSNKQYIKNHCIDDNFAQGQTENLYGLECIDGKKLIIETSTKGDIVSTTSVTNSETGLKIEENLSFVNKFYNTTYDIKETKGSGKEIPWLVKFLPSGEEFTGELDTKYHIIFKTIGNYLVLFKASQNLNELPYTERTSLKLFRDGHLISYKPEKKKEGDYYMVPFIGYPIRYCEAKTITNAKGENTVESRAECQSDSLQIAQNSKYIRITPRYERYNFKPDLKTNLFPAEYFDGLWYYSSGPIERAGDAGELAPFGAQFVKMEKDKEAFKIRDASGDVEERNREVIATVPVKRLEFEINKQGNNQFVQFGEKEKTDTDSIKRPYVQVKFDELLFGLGKESIDLIELNVTPNYLSLIHSVKVQGVVLKWKTSFLREDSVNTEGFIPRKWFLHDHDHVFGILPVAPQDKRKRAEAKESEVLDHYRMIRFNTNLSTEKEKETNTKIIKWYFSNNSTKDPDYRTVGETAIKIYNQAFEYLTKNSDKKIKVELVKDEEKNLGDLRYNIINLVKSEDLEGGSGLLGVAPSYVNPNTGQIIATTSNILIHNLENTLDNYIRNYIRYEIFQKEKRTEEENNIHVVSPYIRKKIQKKCPEVDSFIAMINDSISYLRPRTELSDKASIISCGKKLTSESLLDLILHEMGHSFGLGHNFEASVDSKNYYKSEEEIKSIFPDISPVEEIAQLSSVMDYNKSSQPGMKYLGKYDLAALNYLYFGKLEMEDGSLADLDINPAVKNQKPLTADLLQNRKFYQHCSDNLAGNLSRGIPPEPMCYRHDYGSNPKEIAKDDILDIKRFLKAYRYRYDLIPTYFNARFEKRCIPSHNLFSLACLITSRLNRTVLLHQRWMELRENYLEYQQELENANYILNDDNSINKYKKLIKEGLKSNEQYALYEPIREILPQTIMNLMSIEEMSCHVTDSNGINHRLNLESIKNLLKYSYGNNLYVEDCYSSQILNFLNKNNLTFVKQSGYENFSSYYPKTSPQYKADVLPIKHLFQAPFIHKKTYLHITLMIWTMEPDLLKSLTEKALENLLDFEKNKSDLETDNNLILLNTAFIGLKVSLNEPNKKQFLDQHLNNMKFIEYKKGTGTDSFYKKVIEPLGQGLAIQNIEVPYLTEAYKEYNSDQKEESFLDYLLNRKDIFEDKSGQNFIMPFEMNSFSSKVIRNYNDSLNKIKELEEKQEDLSVIEKLNKENLQQYTEVLNHIMTNKIFR